MAARSALRQCATKHLQDVLCSVERFDQPGKIGPGGVRRFRLRYEVARLGASLLIFALQVRQCHSEIAHGHVWRTVSEELHNAGKAYPSTEHECGIRVPELVRDDPPGDSCSFGDLVEGFAESAKQHLPSARP